MTNRFLKITLTLQALGVLIYTFFAIKNEGVDLISIFVKNILALNWSGQFNLDFLCYLLLSGFWIMWRNNFNSKSIITGFIAMVLGIIFFAPYILWLIHKENGNLKRVLVGDR